MKNKIPKFNEINGLGDLITFILHTGPIGKVVHWITGRDGPCDGCEERRNKFNEALKFRKEG